MSRHPASLPGTARSCRSGRRRGAVRRAGGLPCSRPGRARPAGAGPERGPPRRSDVGPSYRRKRRPVGTMIAVASTDQSVGWLRPHLLLAAAKRRIAELETELRATRRAIGAGPTVVVPQTTLPAVQVMAA